MKLKRLAISLFVLLNLATVLFSNRPAWAVAAVAAALQEEEAAGWGRTLAGAAARRLARLTSLYAASTGLDPRWQMFGRIGRFDWAFHFAAVGRDGRARLLPLPFQSPRRFWDRHLFDFREMKFHLNLYSRPALQTRYAHYLCRRHPQVGGWPTRALRVELHTRAILPPEAARRRGYHLAPEVTRYPLQEVRCSPRG